MEDNRGLDQIAPRQRGKSRRTNRNMFQDVQGRWWLDYYTPEGQRRRKLCGTHEEAKAALAEIDLAKRRETYVDPNVAPTFKEYSEKYLETVSVHKESHEREERLMKNLLDYFGVSRLSKVKRSRVIEYRKARIKSVKPSTVNREIALLRHMFNVAMDEGIVAFNPARGGPGMKAFKEQRRTRYLEMEEIETLLIAIQARIAKNSTDKLKSNAKKFWQYLHTSVTMALHTGMRKGEILGLKWDQINWEKCNILLTDTKNGEPRRVPIDSILLHELSEQRQRIEKSEFVFPSYDRTGKVVALADVKVAFGRVLKDAGILNFRFHDLRHTFASHYMMSGGNLYTLAKILGHKDIKMTQRYADLSPDFIDRERERLDTIWTPPVKADAGGLSPKATPKYLQ
jgi:integrase